MICKHSLLGEFTYCPIYNEEIDDEVAGASDCPRYDEDKGRD